MDFDMEMKNADKAKRSSADLVERDQPPVKDPFWKRWIDSFRPMELPVPSYEETENGKEGQVVAEETGLKRTLSNRHIQMIAIGGAIGTGLFIGSGRVLASSGPASLILGFILVGAMLFNVVMALGEMAILYPIAGSFSVYSARFIDPAWGFAMGWNYALQWLVVLPLELTAAAITIKYWGNTLDEGIWITIFLAVIIVINFFGVKGYGEAEFVFSMVKIIAVVGFIVLGVVIDVGGAPNGGYLGARTWSFPGAFNHGFQGFCSVFVTAAFAFSGTELVGLAAAESDNPRKTLPKATKQVFWRISIFYCVTLFLIGLIVPYTHPRLLGNGNITNSHDAAASPFVIAITDAGIKILPSIFNGVILVAVLSVGNSSVYGSSRTLCALAHAGQAPKILGYIDRQGRPLVAIILALTIGGLAYIVEAGQSAEAVFTWLLAISGLSVIFTWMSICWAHLRFRAAWKAQGHTLLELPFTSALGVVGSIFGVVLNILILMAEFLICVWPLGSHPATAAGFFKGYLAVPIVILFFIFWKLMKRTPFMVVGEGRTAGHWLLRTAQIDLVTGRREIDLTRILAEERAKHATLPAWRRFYKSLCG